MGKREKVGPLYIKRLKKKKKEKENNTLNNIIEDKRIKQNFKSQFMT